MFIITEWLGLVPEAYHMYFLIFAYILLGGRIVLTALKNIAKGNVFDENFLMTVEPWVRLLFRLGKRLLALCSSIAWANTLSNVR